MQQSVPPKIVQELAARILGNSRPQADRALIVQSGRMRQDENKPWMRFKAFQSLSIRSCEFEWRAKTGPVGLIHVRDALKNGAGVGSVSIAGLVPIVRARASVELNRGQLMRYLAEIPWAPAVILENPDLRWQVNGEIIRVATGESRESSAVEFELNSEGLIKEVYAPDRPRAVGKSFVEMPWRGHFSDYRDCGGVMIPYFGRVGWMLEGRERPVWEARIESWQMNAR